MKTAFKNGGRAPALFNNFKYNIKELAKANNLSDYNIHYDAKTDRVILITLILIVDQQEKEQQIKMGSKRFIS
ncbi:MAG: hypothetical protein ACTS73_09675 [Arsenophonus sp. NEOnobi-MAG3]